MGHFGANWLERQSRSKEENPQLAVELLELKKNMVVADFGAGTGYFTSQLATRCSLVFAVDIQPEMILLNKKNMLSKNIQNVKYIIEEQNIFSAPGKQDINFVEHYYSSSNGALSFGICSEPQRRMFSTGKLIPQRFKLMIFRS